MSCFRNLVVCAVALTLLPVLACRQQAADTLQPSTTGKPDAAPTPAQPSTTALPSFAHEQVGPDFRFRPTITNVQVVDFDGSGEANDLLVCDAQRNSVWVYERDANGAWQETLLADKLLAPAHATLVDIDDDADQDVVVSVMGNLHPDDGVIGSVVLLEQTEPGNFRRRTLLDDVRRVVDAQPGDFDNDGDIDLAVAVFGYLRGEILWLEQLADGTFRNHPLHVAPGTIHVPVADYDNDGDPDIAAVVSQDEEEVWLFENDATGKFRKHKLFQSINYDLGTAGLVRSDLDQDGDWDLLLPVGDNLEDRFSHGQPYHGCLWLENQGELQFRPHRICHFPGTYAADAADLDNDGDMDVVLASMTNDWDAPDGHSIVWLENDGKQSFTRHAIANSPIQLVTVACGDVNQDGAVDVVAGGLHVFRPYDRLGRVSCWINQAQGAPGESIASAARSVPASVSRSASESVPGIATGESAPSTTGAVPVPSNLGTEDPITRVAIGGLITKLAAQVAQDEDRDEDWLRLGNIYFGYGFFESAHACYEKATTKTPGSTAAHFIRGITLGRIGRLRESRAQLQLAAELADERAASECWYEVGKCCLRLELAAEAEAAFARAGSHAWSLYERAKLRVRSSDPQAALPVLDELAKSYPAAIEYFLLRANAYEAIGDLAEAKRLRDMASYNSRRLPTHPYADRIDQTRRSIGLEHEQGVAFGHIRDKQWDAACTTLTQLLASGWNQQAYLLLASAELKRQNADEAIRVLQTLMQDCGEFPAALLLLGDAYLATGEPQQARRTWETLADMRSGIALHRRLAQLHDQLGDATNATLQRAKAFEAQGLADLRTSKISLAAKSFEQATRLDPTLRKAWFYLGECFRLRGQSEQAQQAYEKYKAL